MRVATTQIGFVSSTLPQPAKNATISEAPTPMSTRLLRVCRCNRATKACA